MKQTSFLKLQKNIGMTRITSHVIDYIETMGQKKNNPDKDFTRRDFYNFDL